MKNALLAFALAMLGATAHAQMKRDPTPQQQLMTTCNAEAKNRDLKGEDRKKYMSTCLSDGRKRQQEVMRSCNAEARGRSGDERRKFMAECLAR